MTWDVERAGLSQPSEGFYFFEFLQFYPQDIESLNVVACSSQDTSLQTFPFSPLSLQPVS